MKNFFQKNGIMMLAAVTVVAVLLCVASALSSQTGFLQNAGGVIASPFRAVGSAVSGWFSSISQRFEDVEALQQENAELKKENAELQRQLDQAKIDSEENQRLRNLLNLRQQRRDFTFESAVIVDRSTSNWSRVMTLNKGTSSGIAVGNCVVDDQGNLVGVIREAGLNWSTITTILDTDSSLGARVFRTGEVTVAMGDLALMETGRLKLSYLEGEITFVYATDTRPVPGIVRMGGDAAEDKQFIVVKSKGGNYFYIIVDRAAEGGLPPFVWLIVK